MGPASVGLWNVAAGDPSRPAVVEAEGGAVLTFGELAARANQVLHGLGAAGVRHGDVVAAVLPNGAALLEVQMASQQGGFYLTPVNHRLTAPEIAYVVEDSGARVLVCDERYGDACRPAVAALPSPPACFAVGEIPGFRPYAALTDGMPATRPGDRAAGAAMHYTSGTTGRPKGVRRPLTGVDPDAAAERWTGFLRLFGIEPHGGGVHLTVSPLYHTAVMVFATTSLHAGHTVVLMDGWTPEDTLRLIREHRVTTSHMVPTQLHRLLALPAEVRAAADTSSLTHVVHSAAPCPPDVKRRMLEWWGPVIYEYYAATEGGGTVATPRDWLAHPGTVGRAWPGAEVRVEDDEGSPCPPGVPGTVWMSLDATPFEYHRDDEKTRSGRRGRFFTVGDVGYLDGDGFLFLCDRRADIIISGGVNIYPAEVENVLFAHPGVADAAVFGVPDPEWGEQVRAVVQPAPAAAPGTELAAEIIEFCRARLAGYKCPRTVDFAAALPREPTGKLARRALRDPYWAGVRRAI